MITGQKLTDEEFTEMVILAHNLHSHIHILKEYAQIHIDDSPDETIAHIHLVLENLAEDIDKLLTHF